MSNKILFFGNERLATGVTTTVPVLQTLIAAGFEITGVVVAQETSGPSRNSRPLEIVQVTQQHGIPLLSPGRLADAKDDLKALGADAGVLVAYGKIIPQEIINIFPKGIINLHPSLLPKHRGPTPLESVLLAGETETGVSIMQLAAGMDSGPVYAQMKVELQGNETKQALADMLLEVGKDMLHEILPLALKGSLQPSPQNDSDATYDYMIEKSVGTIDWQKTAVELDREVRAYSGWPRSRTTLGRSDVIITAAHVGEGKGTPGDMWVEDRKLGLYASDGILIIDRLIPAGKKEMDAMSFLAGYEL